MKKIISILFGIAVFCFVALFLFGEYERFAFGQSLMQPLGQGEGGLVIICDSEKASCTNLQSDPKPQPLNQETKEALKETYQDNRQRVVFKPLSQSSLERFGKIGWCLGFDTTPDWTSLIILQDGKITSWVSPMVGTDIFGRVNFVSVVEKGHFHPCSIRDAIGFRRFMKATGLPPV